MFFVTATGIQYESEMHYVLVCIRFFEKWDVLCEHLWRIGWSAARGFHSLSQTVSMVTS